MISAPAESFAYIHFKSMVYVLGNNYCYKPLSFHMHFQSLIKIFLSCALAAWTCQTFGVPQQAEGSLSVDNMDDAIPLDRSLQAYYIHYVHDMGKKGDEIACYLKALAQGEVGVEEMPEWLQGIENDQEKLKRFYTMLYLVYWYNAERRREILSFLENVNLRQRGALTLGEPPLQMMMRFNALSSDFEPLTSFLLENGNYDPDSYLEGYHMCAWAELADSPRLLGILIEKGAHVASAAVQGTRVTPFRIYCEPSPHPNLIGMLMDSHAVVKTRRGEAPFGNGRPDHTLDLSHLLAARDRSHGVELLHMLHRQGCPVVSVYRHACLVNHLIGERNITDLQKNNSLFRKQKNWDTLYTYLRLLESIEMKYYGVNRKRQELIPFEFFPENCDVVKRKP